MKLELTEEEFSIETRWFCSIWCLTTNICTQASDEPLKLDVEQLNNRIQERIRGDLLYLAGASIVSSTVVNKMICTS